MRDDDKTSPLPIILLCCVLALCAVGGVVVFLFL